MQRYTRSIWTVSACMSLLSTRHLVVESNFHYPFLLFCAQLGVGTCIIAFTVASRCRTRHKLQEDEHSLAVKFRIRRGTQMILVSLLCRAVSFLFILQAVLHFYNLPTLIMLTTIAFLAEDVLLLLSGLRPCSQTEVSRISALLLACVGILAAEYRLSVPILVATIPAMILAGTGNAVRRVAITHYPEHIPGRVVENKCLVGAGYLVAAIWTLCFWPNDRVVARDLGTIPPLLPFNVAITTLTLWMGRSVIVPDAVNSEVEQDDNTNMRSQPHVAWILVALNGAIGCYCTLTLRRSYTTWHQYFCFAVAVICILCRGIVNSQVIHDQQHNYSNVYELLEGRELLHDDEDEAFNSTQGSETDRLRPKAYLLWSASRRTVFLGLALTFLYAVFAYTNFSTPHHSYRSTILLDLEYEPLNKMEIVLSMYKEPIEVVKQLVSELRHKPATSGASVTIYMKDQGANTDNILRETGADKVIKRPNVGREGETYLYHILDNWEDLAKHTMFLQADIHNHREFFNRLSRFFDPWRTGFLNLGWQDICDCESCGDRFFWHDNVGLLSTMHSEIYSSTSCKNIMMGYKGQFIASAARIRGNDKTIYHDLWQAFVNETSWAHQPDFLQGRPDSLSAPDFGYSIERMWPLLFQCSDMDIAWRCPTLLSGWRLGGDDSDCQCFDPSTLGM